jgi:hypothetical protein
MSKYHLSNWEIDVSFKLKIFNDMFFDNREQNVQNFGAVVSSDNESLLFRLSVKPVQMFETDW